MNKLVLLLIFYFNSYCQEIAMIPQSGIIAFKKSQIITDTVTYKKSTKKISEKMLAFLRKTIIMEQMEQKNEVDSIAIDEIIENISNDVGGNLFLEFFGDEFGTYRFYHTFQKGKVDYYYTLNNELPSDTLSYDITVLDKRLEAVEDDIFKFPILKILDVKEFKNETKLIEGYLCYKVDFKYREIFDVNDFDSFKNDLNKHKEMWVTEKIRVPIHPVIQIPEILDKYYPLEIIEYTEDIGGFITKYELVEFSLK